MDKKITTVMDGDQWCAYYTDYFVCLAESVAGFGNTPNDAIADLTRESFEERQTRLYSEAIKELREEKNDTDK